MIATFSFAEGWNGIHASFMLDIIKCEIFCGRGEMVYTLVLGTNARKCVGVQVLSPAQMVCM